MADVALPDGFAWESAGTTSVGAVGPQTFTAKYTPTDTNNYNVVTGINVQIQVGYIMPTIATITDKTYTGSTIAIPELSIASFKGLTKTTDYTFAYNFTTFGSTTPTTRTSVSSAGTYELIITGAGNYAGQTQTQTFVVNKAERVVTLTNYYVGGIVSDISLYGMTWDSEDANYATAFEAGANTRYIVYAGTDNYLANNHLAATIMANRMKVTTEQELKNACDNEAIKYVHVNSDITITQNYEMPASKILVVDKGKTFTVAESVNLYINSLMDNRGTLQTYASKMVYDNFGGDVVPTVYGNIIYKMTKDTTRAALTCGATRVELQNDITTTSSLSAWLPSNAGCKIVCVLDLNGFNINGEIDIHNKVNSTSTIKLIIENSKYETKTSKIIAQNPVSDYLYGYGIVIDYANANVAVVLKNIEIEAYQTALYTNGTYANASVKAIGCKFTATAGVGVYLAGNHTYNFTDCTFNGGTAYYTKSGSHTVTNCTLTGANDYTAPVYNDDGCDATGSAMVVDSCNGYINTLVVSVTNSTINSTNGYGIEECKTAPEGTTAVDYATITATSNTYNATKGETIILA